MSLQCDHILQSVYHNTVRVYNVTIFCSRIFIIPYEFTRWQYFAVGLSQYRVGLKCALCLVFMTRNVFFSCHDFFTPKGKILVFTCCSSYYSTVSWFVHKIKLLKVMTRRFNPQVLKNFFYRELYLNMYILYSKQNIFWFSCIASAQFWKISVKN